MTRSERNQDKKNLEAARRAGEPIYVSKFTGIAYATNPADQARAQEAARITEQNQAARSAAKDAKAQRAILENKRNVTRAQSYLNSQPSGPQQGAYYNSQGQYTGPQGGGVQSSRLSGSIKPAGVEELERQAQQARNAGEGQRYQDLKSRIAQTYQDANKSERARILAKQTPGGYRTINGRGQTMVTARVERVTPLSPGFAGKASAAGINVVRDDRPLLQDGPLGLRSTGTQVGTRLGPLERVPQTQDYGQRQDNIGAQVFGSPTKEIPGNTKQDRQPHEINYTPANPILEQNYSPVRDSPEYYKKLSQLPSERVRSFLISKFGERNPVSYVSRFVFGLTGVKNAEEAVLQYEEIKQQGPEFLRSQVNVVQTTLPTLFGKPASPEAIDSVNAALGISQKQTFYKFYSEKRGDILEPENVGSIISPFAIDYAAEKVATKLFTIGTRTTNVVKDIDVVASGVTAKSGVGLPGTRTPTKMATESVAIVKSEEQNSYLFGSIKGKPKQTTKAYIMDTKSAGGFDETKGAIKTKTTIQQGTPNYDALIDDVAGQRSLPASFVGKGKPVKVSQGRYGFLKDDQGNVLIAGAEKTRVVNLDYTPQARKNLDRSLLRTTQKDYKIQAVSTGEGDTSKIVGETFKEGETLGVSQNRPYFSQKDIKAIRNPQKGKIDSVDVTISKTLGVVDEGPARRVVRYNAKTGQFVDTPNFVGGERKVIGQVGIKKKLNADIPTTDTRDLSINKILRERPKKQIDYLKAPETQKPKVLTPEVPDTPNIISVQKQAKQSQQAENILSGARGQNVEKRVLKDYLGGPRTQPIRKTIPVKLLGSAAGTIGKASLASGLASKLFGKQKSNLLGGQKPKQNTDLGFDTGQEGKQLIDPIQQRTPDTSQTQKPKQDQFLKLTTISIPGITTIPGPGTPPPPNKPIIDVPGVPFNFNRSGGRSQRYNINRNPFAGTRKYKTATPQQFLNKLTGKKLLKKNKRKGVF